MVRSVRPVILIVTLLAACAEGTIEGYPQGGGIGPGGWGPGGGDSGNGGESGSDTAGGDSSGGDSNDSGGTGDDGATSDTGDGGSSGSGDPTDSEDDGGETPDYDAEILPIWGTQCLNCHGPKQQEEGLDLSQPGKTIVGVPSTQLPSMPLIQPGSTAQSYLWHKLVGDQAEVGGSGEQMPQGKPPLGATELALIQAWIEAGAPL